MYEQRRQPSAEGTAGLSAQGTGTLTGDEGERAASPALRVSSAERDAAVDRLHFHASEGRLELEELDERLGAALRARTRADLDATLRDLPGSRLEAALSADDARSGGERFIPYLLVMALLLTIWLVSGAGHFWPLYPALGWGIPLLLGAGCHPSQPSR